MEIFRKFRQFFVPPVVLAFLLAMVPLGAVRAELVTTDQVLSGETTTADRAKVAAFLDRSDVREQLVALGVNPAQARARVSSLSDSEIRQIAGRLDTMPAGEGIAAIIGTIVIVGLVVLFITELLGVTNLVPFIQPPAIRSRR